MFSFPAFLSAGAPLFGQSAGPLLFTSATDDGNIGICPGGGQNYLLGIGAMNSDTDGGAGAAALIFCAGGIQTNRGLLTDAEFAVPAGATITGMTVHCRASVSAASVGMRIQLRHAGGDIGSAKQLYPGYVASEMAAGSPTDLWAAVLTPEMVNDPSFGVAVSAFSDEIPEQSVAIGWIKATVHYSLPP